MLDESILRLPTKEARTEAIKDDLLTGDGDGIRSDFTYTEVMLLDEALQTLVFEVLDGVMTSSQNTPQYGASKIYNVGPVRLVSLNDMPMVVSKWHEARIPGTNRRAKPVKKTVTLGTDVMVDDSKDNGRMARRLLLKDGWPIRNIRSRSGSVGTIVEMRWLEKAAAEPGDTEEHRELRELLSKLKARDASAEAPKNMTQARAKQPAGASP